MWKENKAKCIRLEGKRNDIHNSVTLLNDGPMAMDTKFVNGKMSLKLGGM